jgi:hypothetical protein
MVTSSFGVGRRENHDPSGFYAGFDPAPLSVDEQINQCDVAGRFFCAGSRDMVQVADNSVAPVVTSPPYNAAKTYRPTGRPDRSAPATRSIW